MCVVEKHGILLYAVKKTTVYFIARDIRLIAVVMTIHCNPIAYQIAQ